MNALRRMIQLIGRDFSDRNIAIELNLGRSTVSQYHQRIRDTGKSWQELLELNDKELTALLQQPVKQQPDPRLTDFMYCRRL